MNELETQRNGWMREAQILAAEKHVAIEERNTCICEAQQLKTELDAWIRGSEELAKQRDATKDAATEREKALQSRIKELETDHLELARLLEEQGKTHSGIHKTSEDLLKSYMKMTHQAEFLHQEVNEEMRNKAMTITMKNFPGHFAQNAQNNKRGDSQFDQNNANKP